LARFFVLQQDCKVYCEGIQEQPMVVRYTGGNLTQLERKFWGTVCKEGCHAAQQQQQQQQQQQHPQGIGSGR
jgi:hypothetical protein